MDDTHRLTGTVRMNGIAGLVGRVGMDAIVAIALGNVGMALLTAMVQTGAIDRGLGWLAGFLIWLGLLE